ncbi:MFS transporter [Kitasatospora viridis]|uniref:EmrB/QacA subfamily drug resistance transporter n=1 Tax=Kitasatospora viridis TaxID=281105 RepID=A0A561SFE9_9ACTN|nr:MFS transporter [Kitasatospora viridis]TWF73599.1 EmrB/QacA subfamily drug resistance transporter [Kitasatospora viridis]
MDMPAARRKTVLACLCATLFMAMLDNVVVNTALPRIGERLHAGVSSLQWVVEGYSLVYAALLLTGGSLGDRFGRTRVYLIGLGLFTAGSAAAALSPGIGALVAARGLQGVGAALLTPGSLAIIRQVFTDERERAKAIGTWSSVSALGLTVGPVIGGPIVQHVGWAGVFWINVPIGLAALPVAARTLPRLPGRARGLDLPGQLLSALGVGGLVYALVEGPGKGWTDRWVLAAGALAAVGLLAFLLVERRTAEPMFDLRMVRDRVLVGAELSGFVISFGVFGALFFLPLLMQGLMGWSPTAAGIAALPNTAMIVVAAPVASALSTRFGPRYVVVTGLGLGALALAGLSCYGSHAHYLEYIWVLMVLGLGMGLTFTPVSIAVLRRVPPQQAGMASATVNTMRELGGVVGVAALGAVLSSRMTASLTGPLERLGGTGAQAHQIARAFSGGTGAGLPGAVRVAAAESFVDGLHLAMRCGAGALAVAAVVVAVLLKPVGSPLPAAPAPAAESVPVGARD